MDDPHAHNVEVERLKSLLKCLSQRNLGALMFSASNFASAINQASEQNYYLLLVK